jgi:hypothetical protein
MFQEYTHLSEEELDEKLEEIMAKIVTADRMGLEGSVQQLVAIRDNLQAELMERLHTLRFDDINKRTPDSLVIGEDDDADAPTDEH